LNIYFEEKDEWHKAIRKWRVSNPGELKKSSPFFFLERKEFIRHTPLF